MRERDGDAELGARSRRRRGARRAGGQLRVPGRAGRAWSCSSTRSRAPRRRLSGAPPPTARRGLRGRAARARLQLLGAGLAVQVRLRRRGRRPRVQRPRRARPEQRRLLRDHAPRLDAVVGPAARRPRPAGPHAGDRRWRWSASVSCCAAAGTAPRRTRSSPSPPSTSSTTPATGCPSAAARPGPRFLIPALPFLAIGLASAYRRFPRADARASRSPRRCSCSSRPLTFPLIGENGPGTWAEFLWDGRFEHTVLTVARRLQRLARRCAPSLRR